MCQQASRRGDACLPYIFAVRCDIWKRFYTHLQVLHAHAIQAAFKEMFGEDWTTASSGAASSSNSNSNNSKSSKGRVMLNAADACAALGIDGGELEARWSKLRKGKEIIKMGGGFYWYGRVCACVWNFLLEYHLNPCRCAFGVFFFLVLCIFQIPLVF